MTRVNDMTSGSVSRTVLGFFTPMLLSNLLQQIYNFADTAVVGKGVGDEALAAVGNMSSLSFLAIGFSIGMSNGFSVVLAHNYGAGDIKALKRSFASAIKLAAVISALLTALSLLFLRRAMLLMQVPEEILEDSLGYGYIIFGGLAASMTYNVCAGALRALGDSQTPFRAVAVSSVTNIVLDCVFVFGLGAGVKGAAAATVAATCLSAAICIRRIGRVEELSLSREDFRSEAGLCSVLLKNGLPMALMNSITAIGCAVVQYFVNGLGVAYTSAYSACSKYENIFMLPSVTAGYTMSAFAGQNYGAGKYDRIREGARVCVRIVLVSYAAFGSAMILFPRALASVMLNGEDTLALAEEFLPICGTAYFLVCLLFVFRNAVQGMGKPFLPMISGVAEMALRITTIVLFIKSAGFAATAYAEAAAWAGALLLNGSAYFHYIRRLTARPDISARRSRIAN